MNQRIIKNLESATFRSTRVIPVGDAVSSDDQQGCDQPVHVECVRDGGEVQRIDVHCHCGKVIRLVCEYGERAA